MTVYIDVVFLWNSISALLLFFSAKLFYSLTGKTYRLIISAMLGGAYGVLCAMYPEWQRFSLVMLFLMTAIAWGRIGVIYNVIRVIFLEAVVVVVIVVLSNAFGINAMVIGGGISFVSNDIVTALVLVSVYPIVILVNRIRQKYKRIIKCVFYINGKEIRLNLLYDSGNLLTYKSCAVAVVYWRNFSNINSYEDALLSADERMIYSTVSSSGVMPLIKPEKAVLAGVNRDCYIGLTNRKFNGYAGVIGDIKGGGK